MVFPQGRKLPTVALIGLPEFRRVDPSLPGMTFREHIREMKRKVNNKEMKVGALWWRKLKAEFLSGEHTAESQLLALEQGTRPSGQWYEAFKQLISHKPSKAPMRSLAQTSQSMSKMEVIIMMRGLMLLSASSNNDSYHLMLEIMRCVARLGLQDTYPDIIAVGFKQFDAVLVQASIKGRVGGRSN